MVQRGKLVFSTITQSPLLSKIFFFVVDIEREGKHIEEKALWKLVEVNILKNREESQIEIRKRNNEKEKRSDRGNKDN